MSWIRKLRQIKLKKPCSGCTDSPEFKKWQSERLRKYGLGEATKKVTKVDDPAKENVLGEVESKV